MTEHPPHSGSRWEPTDASAPAAALPIPTTEQPTEQPAEQLAAQPGRVRRWTGRGRRAPLAAAAAVGLVAAAGTGGFAIGHEVGRGPSDGSSLTGETRDGQQPGTRDGQQPGRDRGGLGPGRPGPGDGRGEGGR